MAIGAVIECEFLVHGQRFAALRWGNEHGARVLALHGWLDNAGSFDQLASRLASVDLVALDLAGHGLSDHRSADSGYDTWQDVGDVIAILDQLGWDQCTLLGHSRGAVIASLLAACFPQRFERLILLDFYRPLTTPAGDFPRQLAQSVLDSNKYLGRSPRHYPGYDKVVEARMQTAHGLSRPAAETLAKRGTRAVGEGYSWRHDVRLYGASRMKLTPEQADAVMEALACPVTIILGRDSGAVSRTELQELLERKPLFQVYEVPGGHHFHMEEGADDSARIIDDLLMTKDLGGKG